ncbi:hypothetical protein [Solilutibacter silvestris]|uniref:hypothetical protein n=1 Tax=Solilutibacter silvestris TaxID=1645665 RepID=UPI003D326AF2
MKKSDKIATQALEISKTANDIALGTKIEPGILEFSTLDRSDFQYDFTDQSSLKDELRYVIHLYNRGHRPISAVSAQIIGVEPLTYQLSNPGFAIRSLPSFDWKLDFNSAVLPSGSVAIDIRKPILVYLKKLSGQLPQKNSVYMTSINFVVSTKSVGDDDFIGISGNQKIHDRELITIRFIPSIIKTEIATTILSEDTEQHRVYSP